MVFFPVFARRFGQQTVPAEHGDCRGREQIPPITYSNVIATIDMQ